MRRTMFPSSAFIFAVFLLCLDLALSTAIPHLHRITKREELGVGRTGKPLPDLFSATLEDLVGGLAEGSFTSVDLVTVHPNAILD
jgi:hypothetical protein